jgi:hypothetical protein
MAVENMGLKEPVEPEKVQSFMELKLWVSFFRKVDSSEENLFSRSFKFNFEVSFYLCTPFL